LIIAFSKNDTLSTEEFVFLSVQKIKTSQLEEALHMLPFPGVMLLLENVSIWMERVSFHILQR
jgi:hypothetical protein